jgi:opacity protein-like surface antigen
MAGSVQAAERKFYFAASVGINKLLEIDDSGVKASFDPGYGFLFAAGLDAGQFRVEGEIGYRSADVDDLKVFGTGGLSNGDISVLSFMANGYYDFEKPNSSWTPYVGAGLGIIDSDLEGNNPSFRVTGGNTNLAYQFMLGLAYQMNSSLALTAGYRFLGTFAFDENVMINELNLGLRFMF